MTEAPVPVRSFGALARAALAHPEWPDDVSPRERSLASLLSKLDRETDLEWLDERPAVQSVFAEVLGVPRDQIRASLKKRLGSSDEGRVVRWVDAPFGAPFSLADEPLPPGIPAAVGTPSTWGSASHWPAGVGAGRTIAGRWLEARGLATFVRARTFAEAVAHLPPTGPAFVELETPLPEDALPPGSQVLVAAPPGVPGRMSPHFRVLASEPPETWLPQLVTWLARRLPRDGRFDALAALRWLTRARAAGLVDSFGAALGLCSLVDLYGSDELERVGVRGIAERFVKDRVAGTRPRDEPGAGWLDDGAYSLLVRLARRLLTEPATHWDAPRTRDEWVALVPPELRESVDTEWVRRALGRATSLVTVRELERSLQELPPGSFRLIQAFARAGLLVTVEDGRLSLGPRWLALHVTERAREDLATGLPEEWGEALLAPTGAPTMARRIHARAIALDETLLDDVLETDGTRSPAAAAAVEMAFRATGLSLLSGDEYADEGARSDEALPLLWEQALSLVLETPEGPRPCIDYPEAWTESEPLLHVGTFRLAALALSETLPPSRGRQHPLLRPWSQPPPELAWRPLLDSVWSALARADPRAAWVLGAFELFGRLRSLHAGERPLHPLEWPSQVALDIAEGNLTWTTWKAGATATTVRALPVLGNEQRISAELIGRSVWTAWLREPEALVPGSSLFPLTEPGRTLLRYVPGDALGVLVDRKLVNLDDIPFEDLSEEAWGALERRVDALGNTGGAWAAMPARVLHAALRDAATRRTSLGVAWASAPTLLLDALGRLEGVDHAAGLHLACEAPSGLTLEIVPHLDRLARDAGSEGKRRIQQTLHERIRSRAPGFRNAFTVLSRLR